MDTIKNIPISEELKLYWESQNLPIDGGANEKYNSAKIGNYFFKYPNFNGEALVLHDINHLITGYQTNWKGECEVGAWELASGGRIGYSNTWIYPISLILLGFFICPIRTIKAFQQGIGQKNAFLLANQMDIWGFSKNELIDFSKKPF
jgi:hypothetical protein